MNVHLELKLISSPLPEDIKSPEELELYVELLKKDLDIEDLDISDFEENSALRYIAKIMVNSIWYV